LRLPLSVCNDNKNNSKIIRKVMAPMVASSDYAFRCLCRQHGAELTFSQMLHAKNLIKGDDTFVANHCDFYEYDDPDSEMVLLPAQQSILPPISTRPSSHPHPIVLPNEWQAATRGPLIVQLAGHDADTVVRAAEMILDRTHGRVAGIDLNCGCPQGIARKGNYGAFLAERDNAKTVCQILTALRKALPQHVAVSAKIRLPLDPSQQDDRIQRLCATGIHFLTVHGRDLTENKTTVRGVHRERLRAVVRTAHALHVPVVANGGVETADDVDLIRRTTGAAAVMSSEALLERPSLFAAATNNNHNAPETTPPRERFEELVGLAQDYLQWCRYAPPLPGVLGATGGSFTVVRGHLFKFLYRYWNDHTDLRDELANSRAHYSGGGKKMIQRLDQAEDLLERLRERYCNLSDDQEWEALPSSDVPTASWYRRHWPNLKDDERTYRSHDDKDRETAAAAAVPIVLSAVERKRQIRERIAKLQAARTDRGKTATATTTTRSSRM